MRTCNIIYWAIHVVMPILTFGCEIWHVTGNDYESLITFQIYEPHGLLVYALN